jgi:hypothetical protein
VSEQAVENAYLSSLVLTGGEAFGAWESVGGCPAGGLRHADDGLLFRKSCDHGDRSRRDLGEYQFKIGGVTADMGWLIASGNITAKKGGKDFAFPINISLTVAKNGGNWQIAAMHFSTLTGAAGSEAMGTN